VAKNITTYNQRVQPEDRLPRIVVLFDEYANTRRERFSAEASDIDDICTEIGQIGRASGIHLWLGIQQPRRSNMPQALRDNFTTMFIGHQANIGAGQSVTGDRASLKLPDLPGRMMSYNGSKKMEVQMPLISEDDINTAVRLSHENWSALEPYRLKAPDELPAVTKPMTDTERVLELAFNQFDGALKKRSIWELTKSLFSLNQVTAIVEEIVASGAVEFEGFHYEAIKKPGNFYQLELVPEPLQTSITE
jgi:hypothetical protein